MSGSNRHLLPSTSGFGNTYEPFAIKQEEYSDSEDSNSDRIFQNQKQEFIDEGDYGVRDDEVTVKKEADSSATEAESSQGSGRVDRLRRSGIKFPKEIDIPKESSLSEGFSFIRSCLNVILNVDSAKRHELVRAMSSKLKYIEAVTTGKNISKAVVVKSEKLSSSCLPKLFKVQYDSKGQQYDSDGSDGQEATNNETEEEKRDEDEMVRKPEKSFRAVKSEHVGLVRPLGDGSVQCNICDRIITYNMRSVCTACSSYVSRMRTKCRETGTPLPSCRHRDFKGGSSCNSCRLRKYVMLSKKDALPPARRRWTECRPSVSKKYTRKVLRSVKKRQQNRKCEPQKCLVCEKMSPWFRVWRCSACFVFHTRLIARYQAGEELPECDHDGNYAGFGCKGCRRIRLQRESALREPDLAAKLPEMPEMPIANTAHSDEDTDQSTKDNDQDVGSDCSFSLST